jgi:glyoxylate/hydroxypyruvate reductase
MNLYQPNILVYNPKQADAYAYVQRILGYGFTSVVAAASPEEAERYLPKTEVILGWKFPTHILHKPIASTVRWFQSTGAGVDDLAADKLLPQDLLLTRIVDQFGSFISEYVFAYLLYIAKDIPRMTKSQKNQLWDSFISESLTGKIIGVAGLGSIGAEIVRKARAFDMKVYGLSYSGKQAHIVDQHFLPNRWADFVKGLDYLVLTLPLTEKSRYILNKDLLLHMKAEACLVNVGRGALIHESDLITVMQNGHLRAAVLDVFETEPLPQEHDFYTLKNVFVTSHLSGPSTIDGVTQFFVENLKRYINQQPLYGVVDRNLGY